MTLIESGPGTAPVSLAEARAQLRFIEEADTADDAYISALVDAACAWTQKHLGRSLAADTEWTLTLDCFPASIKLPMPPAATVDSVVYLDANGDAQTLSAAAYRLYGAGGFDPFVRPAWGTDWPATADGEPDAVTVTYTAGYETLPAPIKQAILLIVSHYFENREASSAIDLKHLPMGVEALLKDYRQQSF